jgi:hypothetical protein
MNPNQAYYSSASPGPSRGKRLLIVFGLLVLVGGAIALFLFLGRSSDGDSDNNPTTQTEDAGIVLPLATVRDFKFVAPKNMKGYTQGTDFTVDVGDYTTNDNACNLQFGVVPPEELTGSTPEAIASAHLGASSEYGAEGGTPEDADDIVLKAVQGSQRYSIPSFEFEYSRDGVNYKARYGIVLLPGGDRAFIRVYCANTGEAVSDSDLKKITDKAKEITVQVE